MRELELSLSFLMPQGAECDLCNSGDTTASPGPTGKAKGLGILTICEPGILVADFRKTRRLT